MVSNEYTYGIENYYYVFETMVDKLFDGIKESEKKKYNPNGYWQLNNQKPGLASSLRPDTILKRDGATYILDAKMYQYGVTQEIYQKRNPFKNKLLMGIMHIIILMKKKLEMLSYCHTIKN